MKYADIKDGVVVNICVSDEQVAQERGWIAFEGMVGAGWRYDGKTFSAPPRDIEGEWALIRAQRDRLLTESDVYVLPDRWISLPSEKQTEWAAYRQALRDIPSVFTDPINVVFPTKPE